MLGKGIYGTDRTGATCCSDERKTERRTNGSVPTDVHLRAQMGDDSSKLPESKLSLALVTAAVSKSFSWKPLRLSPGGSQGRAEIWLFAFDFAIFGLSGEWPVHGVQRELGAVGSRMVQLILEPPPTLTGVSETTSGKALLCIETSWGLRVVMNEVSVVRGR